MYKQVGLLRPVTFLYTYICKMALISLAQVTSSTIGHNLSQLMSIAVAPNPNDHEKHSNMPNRITDEHVQQTRDKKYITNR